MQVKYKLNGNTMIVILDGDLDEYTAHYVRSRMDKLIDNNKFSKLVIDMSELSFMDSTGVGVLIGRYKKLKNYHTQMYITNPNTTIERIFKMSGLYEIMPKIG